MATTILIMCPECDRQLKAPDNILGKKIRCKYCQAAFVARKGPDKPPGGKSAKSPSGKPPAVWDPKPPVMDDDEEEDSNPYGVTTLDLTPRCPNCANEMDSEEAIVCLHCGYNTRTREQFSTRKVQDTSASELFMWLLPGIACALLVLASISFDLLYLLKIEDWVGKDAWYGELLCHGGIKLWVVIMSLFVVYFAGKFAIKRLLIHNMPPEVEKKK